MLRTIFFALGMSLPLYWILRNRTDRGEFVKAAAKGAAVFFVLRQSWLLYDYRYFRSQGLPPPNEISAEGLTGAIIGPVAIGT